MRPNPFNPFNELDRPALRYFCRHIRPAATCTSPTCLREWSDKFWPMTGPTEPQPRTVDSLIEEAHAKRAIAVLRERNRGCL